MQHEWGHGLDTFDGEEPGYAAGLGDFATGEAVADHVALFVDHDSCIGQSFYNRQNGAFITDPSTMAVAQCNGVRNVDELRANRGALNPTNVTTKCLLNPNAPYYIGPLFGEGHCEGEIWGQTSWHLVHTLETGRRYHTVTLDANKQFVTYAGDPLPTGANNSPNGGFGRDVAWTILEQLYFESRPIVASYAPSRYTAQGTGAYDGFMIADDEGDGLANGTPHAAYINDAFVRHGIEEWAPGTQTASVPNDTKNCTAPGTPNVTLSQATDSPTGTPAVTISWTAVPGATSYSILRTERRDDVFLELARLNTASSITDIGVDNGVTYYYRVQANGGGACFAVSSGGVQSIAVAQPEPAVSNVVITDSPKGNNDQSLDAGETAKLFIVLGNNGLGALTGVSATLRSVTNGITVTTAGPMTYGSINPNDTAGPNASYVIAIAPDGSLCGTNARLVLDVTSDQGCFAVPVTLPMGDASSSCFVYKKAYAQPQSLAITSDSLNTCGDGDGSPDPGEMIQVTVQVNNIGDRPASNVSVKLSSDKAYFAIISDTVSLGSLAALASETKTATFTVSVGAAPFADRATFTASVTWNGSSTPSTRNLATTVNRDIVTQSFNATFETGNDGWTPNGLWTRGSAPTTGDLTTVFHSGYDLDRCDTLVGPEVELSPSSSMSFDLAYVSENSDAPYD